MPVIVKDSRCPADVLFSVTASSPALPKKLMQAENTQEAMFIVCSFVIDHSKMAALFSAQRMDWSNETESVIGL